MSDSSIVRIVLQTLVKHKSKLEIAKESATARTPLDAKKPKAKRPSAGFGGQVGFPCPHPLIFMPV